MPIRFKCPHCKKTLGVKDHLAGRKANCPACKQPIVIPTPVSAPADVDDLAAAALSDPPPKEEHVKPATTSIKFNCQFCDTELDLPLAEAGQKVPCPECRRIIRVPVPQEDKPKDWRQVAKKGPSGALINQPEHAEDAWSSAQKRNVSRGALEEAGLIEEPEIPIGLGGWIKRGFKITVVVGLVVAATLGISKSISEKAQKDAIQIALKMIEVKGKEPAKVKLSPVLQAEVHRAVGEHYCNQKKAELARNQFRMARTKLDQNPKNKDDSPVDKDLFLIGLALSQIELGGTEEEGYAKERLFWKDTQTEIASSLDAISAAEAKVLAIRLVGTRLVEKKKYEIAVSLAGQLKAQQVALRIARNDPKDAKEIDKLIKSPLSKAVEPPKVDKSKSAKAPKVEPVKEIDPVARIAYVEGHARQSNYKDARELIESKGPALNRLEACLGAVTAVLADRERPVAEALPFLDDAQKIVTSKELVAAKIPPWLLYQLLLGAAQAGATEKFKDLEKKLDDRFKPHLQLARVRMRIAANESDINFAIAIAEFAKKDLSRAQACEAMSRQMARLSKDDVQQIIQGVDEADNQLLPFLYAGMALGEQDKKK